MKINIKTIEESMTTLRDLTANSERQQENGSTLRTGFLEMTDRYLFDFQICLHLLGWHQYDTDQDASYFGVWYHTDQRAVFSFVEGDTSLVECHDDDSWNAEISEMADFYGEAPPAFTTISIPDGDGRPVEITRHFASDARPEPAAS